ncbi:MAG: hypothetical protein WBM07_00985 [Chitinivibrionales bacterium]
MASNYGIGAFSIDGLAAANVDYYASSIQHQVLLYANTNLAPGTHTLKITVTGTKNSKSTGNTITVDKVEVNEELRVAWWGYGVIQNPPIPANFLSRAQQMGYKYILADVGTPAITAAQIQAVFQEVDQYGMRLIPLMTISSHYSSAWCLTFSNIKNFNTFTNYTYDSHGNITGSTPATMPSFADESDPVKFGDGKNAIYGIDYYFVNTFLSNIRTGFNNAASSMNNCAKIGSSKFLEFIHLGHDECYYVNGSPFLLIGYGERADNAGHLGSQTDKDTINTWILPTSSKGGKGFSATVAFRALMAQEIYRRQNQVRNLAGMPNTKVMIDADMWDPQYNGEITWSTWQGSVTLAPNVAGHTNEIIDLPGLSASNIADVQNNVIFVPWMYGVTWNFNGTLVNYDANATFGYFMGKNFYTMFFASLDIIEGQVLDPELPNTTTQIEHYLSAYYERKDANIKNCLGYVVGEWCGWNPPPADMYAQPWMNNSFEYVWKFQNVPAAQRSMAAFR